MSTQVFLALIAVTAAITSLMTEAVKKLMEEWHVKCYPNTLAAVVAVIAGAAVGAAYMITSGVPMDAQAIVYLVGLVLLSWLCAMVGYDKVKETILQLRGDDKGGAGE